MLSRSPCLGSGSTSLVLGPQAELRRQRVWGVNKFVVQENGGVDKGEIWFGRSNKK